MNRSKTSLLLLALALALAACTAAVPPGDDAIQQPASAPASIQSPPAPEEAAATVTETAGAAPSPPPQTAIPATATIVAPTQTAAPATATLAPPEPTPAATRQGGDLNVWLPNGWPEQSWLHVSNWESEWAISPMCEWLFFPTPAGPEPWLATGWGVSPDGLVYTLHLREGVTWHDGAPFTADDVVYTYKMYADPQKRPLGAMRYGRTVKDLYAYQEGKTIRFDGITAVDRLTVRFTLASPDVALPALLWTYVHMPIVPKHAVEKLERRSVIYGTADYWRTQPVGTGPYQFVRYVPGEYIEYRRNDHYWGQPAGPDRLFMRIASAEAAVELLERGELDLVQPLPPADARRLAQGTQIEVLEARATTNLWALEGNSFTLKGLWTNVKARQALLYAVDRQAYVDAVLQGYGSVVNSDYDGTAYACPTMQQYPYDPAKATALFDELGMTAAKRKETTIDLMSWLGNKPRYDFLPIAQSYLQKLGFQAKVDIIDNSVTGDYKYGGGGRPGRDWDLAVVTAGMGSDPSSTSSFLLPDSLSNWGYHAWPFYADMRSGRKAGAWVYDNPQLTRLFEQGQAEADAQKRASIYQQIDCIVNAELPTMPIAHAWGVAGKSSRLQGVNWPTNGYEGRERMYHLNEWSLSPQ